MQECEVQQIRRRKRQMSKGNVEESLSTRKPWGHHTHADVDADADADACLESSAWVLSSPAGDSWES